MNDVNNSFIASDGVKINYIDVGEGKPLLFVHGFGGASQLQMPIFELLKDRFRCLCFDQRGYGRTEGKGDIGLERSAKDARELLEHLAIDDAVFLGYSMGAGVMFSYIEQFGCKHLDKVIIGEMSPKLVNDDEWKLGLYQGWYTKEQFEKDLEMMTKDYERFNTFFAIQTFFKHTPQEVRDFDCKDVDISAMLERAGGGRPTLEAMLSVSEEQKGSNIKYWKSMCENDYRDILGKISVPAAIIYAVPGSIYAPDTAKYMYGKIPNARLYCYEDCTHMAKNEKLDQFISDVKTFSFTNE